MSTPTLQQEAAITARGNVLVAAGAGTGKTSTVAARCLRLVLDEGCRLDQILMVTFTEAAAAEMRERIRKELSQQAEAVPESETALRLTGELALLDTAPLSTLHSFCLDLVRRNFHALGLDPQVTVLDDAQTQPLIHTVLDEVFLRHYAAAESGGPDGVRQLVRSYGNGRDDGIRRLVVKIHRHTQTLADPDKWLATQIAAFSNPAPEAWKEIFAAGVWEWAHLWRPAVPTSSPSLNVAACGRAMAEFKTPDFAAAARLVEQIVAANPPKWPHGTAMKYREPREVFFSDAKYLHALLQQGAAPLTQDWNWSREPMLTLLLLTQEFTNEFSRAKRELGGIDFADQEQLALRLLYDNDGQLTPVAQACRERFQYVFVDECQDINAAQDGILRAVSREGALANRFLVGDVKQSIYRFRLADPRIFQRYETEWKAAGDGRVLPLTENFRSREALLRFINPLFRELMRPVIGGLHYDTDAELRFGNPTGRKELSLAAETVPAEAIAPRVELHVVEKKSGSDSSHPAEADIVELRATEREARLVAQRLKALKESGHQVWQRDRGVFAPVEYRDMVVLLRSAAGRAEVFAKAFHQGGVPLHAERAGFLEALEVTDLLNLLRLLDNPLQDVPLLAVLRSPLVELLPEELVLVRTAEPGGLFWFALQKFHEIQAGAPSAVHDKVATFLQQFARWRELIRHSSLTHCLETALIETHYEAMLLADERGAARAGNVRRLVELARRFDPYRREGLYRFLRFISEQEEAEVHHEPAALEHENAVRLMTIHASKGLEFPVVALAGLGGKFNLRDLTEDILLNDDLGLCPKVLPPESRRRYPSIAHWVAAQRERRALLGEEMRLLYVALTRARDTLLLVGTASRKDEMVRWRAPEPITDFTLVKASGFLDWLRPWFAHTVGAGEWTTPNAGANTFLRWTFHDPNDARFGMADKQSERASDLLPPTAAELESLVQLSAWRYISDPATLETAKVSVSGLRRRTMEPDAEARPMFSGPISRLRGQGVGLSRPEIGTAHHVFMQFVELSRTASELDLRNQATRLQNAGLLTPEQAVVLDFAALTDFWQSSVGLALRRQPENLVQREMPFTARLTAADLRAVGLPLEHPSLADDEFIVVQGIVDLAVLLPDEIWLLDFKTDAVNPAELPARAREYRPQINLYALALSRIYRKPVTERWLHFLTARKTERIESF